VTRLNPQKQCIGKHGHASRSCAVIEMKKARSQQYGIRPYLCPHCGLWHIGHAYGTSTKLHQRKVQGRRGMTEPTTDHDPLDDATPENILPPGAPVEDEREFDEAYEGYRPTSR
jgi:hypothetical protein